MDSNQNSNEDARRVDGPSGTAPDDELAFDPEMTDTDEGNIPDGSAADPQGDPTHDADATS